MHVAFHYLDLKSLRKPVRKVASLRMSHAPAPLGTIMFIQHGTKWFNMIQQITKTSTQYKLEHLSLTAGNINHAYIHEDIIPHDCIFIPMNLSGIETCVCS